MDRIILDTNVPAKASTAPQLCPEEELEMQRACIEYIGDLVRRSDKKLVLDLDYEIWREYHNNVSKDTSMGKLFFRWLYDYCNIILPQDHIKLEKDENGQYVDYPYDEYTKDFDESDKKFVALSNAHAQKPPIIDMPLVK